MLNSDVEYMSTDVPNDCSSNGTKMMDQIQPQALKTMKPNQANRINVDKPQTVIMYNCNI